MFFLFALNNKFNFGWDFKFSSRQRGECEYDYSASRYDINAAIMADQRVLKLLVE